MSLQVRRSTYRGTSGWLLCGRPKGASFPVNAFFEKEEVARRERAALVANPNHQVSFRPVDTTDHEGLPTVAGIGCYNELWNAIVIA